jgi:hypothetical protein
VTFSTYPFAAALIVDAVQATPLVYAMLYGLPRPGMMDWDEDRVGQNTPGAVIGAPLFGEGIKLWLERSPAFNLHRIRTPLRYEYHGPLGLLGAWDTFAILRRQRRPVELVSLPEESHNAETPLGRYTSQQGSVDWFAFWLNSDEDPDPAKADQYRRWRGLRREFKAQGKESLK